MCSRFEEAKEEVLAGCPSNVRRDRDAEHGAFEHLDGRAVAKAVQAASSPSDNEGREVYCSQAEEVVPELPVLASAV